VYNRITQGNEVLPQSVPAPGHPKARKFQSVRDGAGKEETGKRSGKTPHTGILLLGRDVPVRPRGRMQEEKVRFQRSVESSPREKGKGHVLTNREIAIKKEGKEKKNGGGTATWEKSAFRPYPGKGKGEVERADGEGRQKGQPLEKKKKKN